MYLYMCISLQYESAGRTLVSIGGVDFLSQLRGYCDPSLHPLIDDTLEQLLQVPVSSTSKQTYIVIN
jgi:hypothetical protein